MRPFDPELLRRVPAARAPVAALSVAGVVAGMLAVAQAVCLAWLASSVVTGGTLTAPLTWTVALLVARGLVAGAQESVAGWAGQRVASGLRSQLLRRWSRLPEEARPQPDDAVRRATDGVAAIEPYVGRYLPALVSAAVVPALSVVTLLVVDFWAALIVLLTLPLLPVFAALIGLHTREETRARWDAMTDLAGHFLDVVRGLPTLVAYGRADRQVAVVAEVGRRHRVATVRTLRTAFLSTVALELLATISVALVAVCVGLRLAFGVMDLQVAMTAILLAPEAYWPIRRVGAEFHNAADGAEALEQLGDDLAGSSAGPRPARDTSATGVQVSGLRYHHPGRSDVLVDLDLQSAAGAGLTAVTGPSGAGKTTLLELIAGVRVPSSGTVAAPPAHLATQRPLLLPGTVRSNLVLACPDASDAEMRLALQRVGLWEALAAREGLDTLLGDDGFGLSAGQRGRLGLARALVSTAPLVLLDEPTAHIAGDALPGLHRLIGELARHRRVIVATHDLQLAARADQHWSIPLAASPEQNGPAPAVLAAPQALPTAEATASAPQTGGGVVLDAGGAVTTPPITSVVPDAGATAAGQGPLRRWIPSPRGRLALSAAVGGLATASGVALTATSGWLIVQASYQPVVLTLLVAIVGVRAFGLARPVLRYAERVISHDVALETLAQERTRAFEQLIPLTPARLGRRSRGDVLTAVVRDLDDVTDEKVRVTVPLWGAVLSSAVAALVAGAFLPLAGLVVVLGASLVLLLGRLNQRFEQRAHQDLVASRGTVRRLTAMVTAQLAQVQAVTGVEHADRLTDRIDVAHRVEDAAARSLSQARSLALGLTWVVIAASVGAVGWLAGAAYTAGTLSGPVAALVTLTPMALAEAWATVPEIFGARARAHAARERLAVLFAQQPAVAQERAVTATGALVPADPDAAARRSVPLDEDRSPGQTAPTLSTDAVQTAWDAHAREPDLAPVSLRLEPGDRVVLTGPNGVGKSTLVAVLARHLDPIAGRYCHDATEVRDLPLAQVRGRIAVADDEPHAFQHTVRANLVLARPEAADEELVAALRAADLGHWFDRLPDGLETRITALSGGERTRLSVARGILSRRPVLLLDEPTAHLDEVSATRVLQRLGDGCQSAVMVSHDVRPEGWRELTLTAPERTGAGSGSTHRDRLPQSAISR